MVSGPLDRTMLLLALTGMCLAAGEAAEPQGVLSKGVQQAQEGEYEAAESTLRSAVDLLLRTKPQVKPELVRAHVYLAVAYVGMGRKDLARASFIEALKLDPAIETSAREFPPTLVQFFDGVRRDATASGVIARVPPQRERTAAAAGAKPKKGKGGGSTRWLLIGGGVAAAGGGAAVLLAGKSNTPPTVGSIAVDPPGKGIGAVTSFTLSATASDADGDELEYTWDFGDGSPAQTGRGLTSATHTFMPTLDHSYLVTLRVSDGKAPSPATASTNVVITSLDGVWKNVDGDIERTWTISQSDRTIGGTYYHSFYSRTVGTGTISGLANAPRVVDIKATLPTQEPFTFHGEADADVRVLRGKANGAGHDNTDMVFTRQ